MNRQDFKRLAEQRVRDAEVLLAGRRYAAAYYLCGYAVECALKACIAKQTRRSEFPDRERVNKSWTHDLNVLVKLAELEASRNRRRDNDRVFRLNWHTVEDWSEQGRYEHGVTRQQAADLYNAVTNRNHGVLTWLTNFW